MRSFIAVKIPPAVKEALVLCQTELRSAGANVSWTNPENIHLTLKFFGEVDETSVPGVSQASQETAAGFVPFSLHLASLGAFPNARRARVIWAGLGGELGALTALQRDLEKRLSIQGMKGDEKPFRPHLTLGRVRTDRNLPEMVRRLERYVLPAVEFEVRELFLIKSELLRSGALYTTLAKAELNLQSRAAL